MFPLFCIVMHVFFTYLLFRNHAFRDMIVNLNIAMIANLCSCCYPWFVNKEK